ncbi:MAG: glycosyltransferase family 4 protein [bacterium]|nr:glycosyltransferase family 4 protein [bacterium]
MIKVGVVVQRYGEDVVGGAETLSRDVAERLNASGMDVTVFTTTAKDYITWKKDFSTGTSILKGVNIKRYDVDEERNIDSFNKYSDVFFNPETKGRDEDRWIREQGPYCPKLIDALRKEQDNYDVFLFFTYLYYPTIEGLKVIKKKAILFPTAHDEAPIYMELMKDVFKRPEALFFLTGAEKDFVEKKFNPPNILSLIRTGTDIVEGVDESLFRNRFSQYAPFMLYAGRIERGKGLETVFEAYRRISSERLVNFVLMGKKLMDIPDIKGLKYVGFVSEEEKLSAFKGAMVSIQPSPLESLSITTLESFSQRTPVLVNKQCAVLCEHIDLSGGGLMYGDVDEFVKNLYQLHTNKRTAKAIGIKGYDYVKEYYAWDVVLRKIKSRIGSIIK